MLSQNLRATDDCIITGYPEMCTTTFERFRDYIYLYTGIYFQDNKKYLLEGRLGRRLKKLDLDSFEDYLKLLKQSGTLDGEFKNFLDTITINETYFFRNMAQFNAFEKTIIPEIAKEKRIQGASKLQVWSAACSSGEEPYSISMLYHDKFLKKYPFLKINILGTDISRNMLDIAKQGIYRKYAIRNMPLYYLKKYLLPKNGRYYIDDTIKQSVKFDFLNLFDHQKMRQMRHFDVIFCRNVLIYFDKKAKIKIISNLYNSLNRGGYLFIGYAESLHGISKAFKLVNFPNTVAYKKE